MKRTMTSEALTRRFVVDRPDTIARYASVVFDGIREIHRRTTPKYPASAVFHRFESLCNRCAEWLFLAALDVEKGEKCAGWVVVIRMEDLMGMPLAFVEAGYVSPGYRSEPIQALTSTVVAWARSLGCREIVTCTERNTAAYARWVDVFGCQQGVTLFTR